MKVIAYDDGYRDGRLDKVLGLQSEYAWTSFGTESEYTRYYNEGYFDGWNGFAYVPKN